jgi:hypothetical protein
MVKSAVSRFGIRIRLTDARWAHIIEEHAELAGMRSDVSAAAELADRVVMGALGESLAILAIKEMEPGKWLVVVYREAEDDGFVVTAFSTRRVRSLEQRLQLWP